MFKKAEKFLTKSFKLKQKASSQDIELARQGFLGAVGDEYDEGTVQLRTIYLVTRPQGRLVVIYRTLAVKKIDDGLNEDMRKYKQFKSNH